MKLYHNEKIIWVKHPKHGFRIVDRRWAINKGAIRRGEDIWVVNPYSGSVAAIPISDISKKYKFSVVKELSIEMRELDEIYRARMTTLQRHAKEQAHLMHLKKHGIDVSSGAVRRHQGAHRETACWTCRQPLDSDDEMACTFCGWLLCDCGACGCGYAEHVARQS